MIDLLELLFLLVLVIIGAPVFIISGVMIISNILEYKDSDNEFKYHQHK